MAKIIFGSIVTDMRNRLGADIYSRNRSGAYVKNGTPPSNPDTEKQQVMRGRFSTASAAWMGLSDAQRIQWNEFAAVNKVRDNLGQLITLSGQSMFIGNALHMYSVFYGNLTTPVPLQSMFQPDSVTVVINATTSEFQYTMSPTSLPANCAAAFYASDILPAGAWSIKNKLRWLAFSVTGSSINGYDIWTEYVNAFSAPSAGDKIGAGLYVVNTETGQRSVLRASLNIVTS